MSRSMNNNKLKFTATLLNILQIVPLVIFEVILYIILNHNGHVALNYIPVRLIVVIELTIILWMIIPFFIKRNKAGMIISMIMSGIMIILSSGADVWLYVNQDNINGLFENSEKTIDTIVRNSELSTDEFGVYVLKEDTAEKIDDAKDYTFGYNKNFLNENAEAVIKDINDAIGKEGKYKEYTDVVKLVDEFYNKDTEAIILNQSLMDLIVSMGEDDTSEYEVDYSDFNTKIKCIYTYKITKEIQNEEKEKDITKECFNIYISGIDTFGSITTTSRSDVNIIMSINPKTQQILLLSTPRDYYVPLSNSNGVKDKLTHAGLYGVDVSRKTLEMLYGIEIDYYVRVNFSGFTEIINALGGIDVDSEYAFSAKGYSFNQGMNYNMNGEKALVFARERHSFARGDVQRGKNQMAVIKGIISKCASPSILNNYKKTLESISESFQTSIEKKNIQKFVKFQLANSYEWNIQSYNVTGTGQSNYTYTVPGARAYVMIPDETTIARAKELLKDVTDGKELVNVIEEN